MDKGKLIIDEFGEINISELYNGQVPNNHHQSFQHQTVFIPFISGTSET